MNISKIFAERLKAIRKELGETQEQFAETIGYSAVYVKKMESGKGKTVPPVDTLADICNNINDKYKDELKYKKVKYISIGYLIGEHDGKTKEIDDIQKITGLDEEAIRMLKVYNKELQDNPWERYEGRSFLALASIIIKGQDLIHLIREQADENVMKREALTFLEELTKIYPHIGDIIEEELRNYWGTITYWSFEELLLKIEERIEETIPDFDDMGKEEEEYYHKLIDGLMLRQILVAKIDKDFFGERIMAFAHKVIGEYEMRANELSKQLQEELCEYYDMPLVKEVIDKGIDMGEEATIQLDDGEYTLIPLWKKGEQ